jgi:hypothetical protein
MAKEYYVSLNSFSERITDKETKREFLRLYEEYHYLYLAHEIRRMSFEEILELAKYQVAKNRIESAEMQEIDRIISELKRCYFANCRDLDDTIMHNKKMDKAIKIMMLCKDLIKYHDKKITHVNLKGAIKND